jgi:multiple antibiotic resistance protein
MNLYSSIITLVLVMDPIGNIPIFLSLLKKLPLRRRLYIILRECIIAFFVLVFFVFFGSSILKGLGLSHAAISISGGIILFLIAIKMIFPSDQEHPTLATEPLIVPMAIPLIAGPSALATVLLFANQQQGHLFSVFITVLVASFISAVILLLSEPLRKILSDRGLLALERLMGMILTAMAVQMFLTGVVTFLK